MCEKEINDHITSYIKLIDNLSGEVLISTKGLTKKLINGYSVLNGTIYFPGKDGLQNYYAFEPILRYFRPLTNNIGGKLKLFQMKLLSDESIKPPATSNNSLNPSRDYFNNPKFRLEFNGGCLKANKGDFNSKKINLCIAYEMKSCSNYLENGFT